MRKILINKTFDGIHLSSKALFRILEEKPEWVQKEEGDDLQYVFCITADDVNDLENIVKEEIENGYGWQKLDDGWYFRGGCHSLLYKDFTVYHLDEQKINRDDTYILALFEEMGDEFGCDDFTSTYNGFTYKVVEIPEDVDWDIGANDGPGGEWVFEKHRTWS